MAAVSRKDLDTLHGRLTALEALMVMVLSYRGPDALRQAIDGLGKQPVKSAAEINEFRALKTRLKSALASAEDESGSA